MGTLVGAPLNAYEASGADANIAAAYGTAVEVGDVAIVAFGYYSDTATVSSMTSSVSTSLSATVGALLRNTGGSAPAPALNVHVFVFSAAGTPTFTCTASANVGDKRLTAFVWRGIDNTTPVPAGTAGTNGATGLDQSAETGNITTTSPGPIMSFLQEFVWAASHQHAAGSPSTGWTETGDTATGADGKYRNETATGTFNGNFTWTLSDDAWSARIVALADAAAAGGGEIVQFMHHYKTMHAA